MFEEASERDLLHMCFQNGAIVSVVTECLMTMFVYCRH